MKLDQDDVIRIYQIVANNGLSIAHNRVHAILEEYDHVTDNPNKQGRRRPWVRFERQYAGVTAHMDWYTNEQGPQVLAVEDDAFRRVFDMIETDASSASQSGELLDRVREDREAPVLILEVITDHGSEFINTHQTEGPCLDHEFECYLDDHEIETRSVRLDALNRTGRSSGSSKSTTNTAGGSELLTISSPSITRSGPT